MDYSGYTFVCRFEDTARLPRFKGSLLRGMLGMSLRKAACALTRGECSGCLLASRCVYSLAFEATRPQGKGPTPPHPYLLDPPLDDRTDYAPGEEFSLGLTLFGGMVANLPYFIYAFECMGHEGLGGDKERGRARFTVRSVSNGAGPIYDSEHKVLERQAPARRLDVGHGSPGSAPSRLTLRLLTPLRIKNRNSFAAELPFHLLVRGMLRRIATMFTHFGGGEPALDYPGLVRRAYDVAVVEDATRWKDWTRYSSRQKQAMQFGGLVGSVTYAGDLGEYLPLLEACKVLHVGKQSVFGLGRIDYAPQGAA